ncbi:MAG TPA: hypothetical protein VJT75_11595 [Thermoleophilaceae bacterium]|nr:hypothetical protein [Thermoleophilaceae bacterium]
MARKATLLATVVCFLALAPAGSARTPDCRTAGHTVLANAKVRVYYVTARGHHVYWACAFRTPDRRRPLGSQQDVPNYIRTKVIHTQLRGRFLGYGSEICYPGRPCEWDAYAIDMREGRGTAVQKVTGHGEVRDVLMTRARSLALLTDVSEFVGKSKAYRILKIEQNRKIPLDQGSEIDPRSLAVSRHRVYWMHGDEPRSAHIE